MENSVKIFGDYPNGDWEKKEYDNNGRVIYKITNTGYWEKYQYNEMGKENYWEDSDGNWEKRKYNENGVETFFEDSDGNCEVIEIINGKRHINCFKRK